MEEKQFSKDVLELNPEKEVDKIIKRIRELLAKQLKRRGLVVGLSVGIDSSVTTALAVKAIGAERVLALLMPEQQSADDTLALSSQVADHFGIEKIHEDISEILKAVGFCSMDPIWSSFRPIKCMKSVVSEFLWFFRSP